MKFSGKVYDILAFFGRIVLPSLSTLVITLFKIWQPSSELGTLIGATIMAVDVFLNALLGISSANYYKNQGNEQ